MCVGVSIARTGHQLYAEGESPLETNDDGVVNVHRHEKEVFSDKTIASFEGKPITIGHPHDFVTPKNWARLAKGTMQNVRRGEGEQADDLVADLLITDDMTISLVRDAGLREVSCGYEADYVQTGDGEGKQLNIRGNHLALVEKGRAGSGYAIHDHEGKTKGVKMTLREKIKAHFAKAQDEAMKIVDEDGGDKDKKDDKAKDEKAKDSTMAEVMAAISDLAEKVKELQPAKEEAAASDEADDKDDKKKKAPKKDDAADEDGEESEEGESEEASIDDRMSALEAAVAKILKKMGEAEEEGEEETEEAEDEDDEEESEGSTVGDTASRVEILAPGLKAQAKDAKAKALKVFAGTKEGKVVMASLTGGKAITYDSADRVNHLFIAASEIMKSQRSSDLSKTKSGRVHDDAGESAQGPMTPERMNEINAKHYKR